MATILCSNCIEDPYLKQNIIEEGESGECDVCDEEQPTTISISRLGEILEPILRKHIKQGAEVRRFDSDDDNGYYEQEGDDLDHFVQEILGQYFDFNDEIIEAVIDAEGCWPPDGDEPFFDTSCCYVSTEVLDYEYQLGWKDLRKELQTRRRFFSSAAKEFFDELFSDVDTLLTHSFPKDESGVVLIVPLGFPIYRSRACGSESVLQAMFENPYKEVGPPPPEKARAGRMNPEGISMLYGATEKETCLAELRPPLGGDAATIMVETTETLRLLDFTRMTKAYKLLSYFQSDFEQQAARFKFLRNLGELISRPVTPGHEDEYLITQTMMEYLAEVHSKPFDGVLFGSAQRKGGVNVVLFARTEEDTPVFPVRYVKDSLSISETTEITYKHQERKYRLSDEGRVEPDWDWWDD
jgi:hypothetical protein